MDKDILSHQYFMNIMEEMYPAFPLPSDEQFKICLHSLDGESFALPVIEFCAYAHAGKMNWIECSWENDLLPLEYDTTILPSYIFSTSFLRYYFPACLNLTVNYFLGEYHGEKMGNIDSFVQHALDSIREHYDALNAKEKKLIWEISELIENNAWYDYKNECIELKKIMMGG